jgi:hypothetical protein
MIIKGEVEKNVVKKKVVFKSCGKEHLSSNYRWPLADIIGCSLLGGL